LETFLLQDWVTIAGNPQIASVTQGADAWFDLGAHEDVLFYLEVKELTNTPVMNYQTSPAPQDSLFLPVVTPFSVASGVRADAALFAYALTPPARYLRWQLTSSNLSLNWHVTFRILMAAYSLG
jgi:hypothetical protein